MTEILLRSKQQILGDLVRSIIAASDFTDFAPGSTFATLLEAIASVQFQNYLMVLKLLESTDLESMTGVDLDRKAASIGLPDGIGGVGRKPASPASGPIEITDPRTPKKSSKLYAGKPAPYSGGTVVYVEDASTWPIPGATQPKIYIGRGTASNLEGPIRYVSKTDNGVFWSLQLEGPLTKNHSISETVVLAQGGDRVISAGTVVQTTPNASTPSVSFTIDAETVIFDGDDTTTASVTASLFGESGNALAGALNRFASQPYPQATVRNTTSFANGKSTESDEELRQRIRDYPATLARGTKSAITAALLGLRDPDSGKAVASVVVIEPTEPGDPSKIFINDGSLLEPTFSGQPYELFVKDASGQEVFFKTTYAPVTPCVGIGANQGPYALEDQMQLTITVDGVNETYTVTGSDYQNLETATPFEIVRDFNAQANICSFRTIDGAKGIAVFDLSGRGEIMNIQSGTLQATLGLPTTEIRPIYLYKDGESLSFKGKTATLTTNQYPWSMTASDLRNFVIRVDNSYQVITITDADFASYFSNIISATIPQWISVLKKKINGVNFAQVGNRIVWSTFQTYTTDSYLEIMRQTARSGVYYGAGANIVITTEDNYALSGSSILQIFNASDSNLNGEYVGVFDSSGTLTTITIPSILTTTGSLYWLHTSNPDAGWIGPAKMWLSATSSSGATKDFQFNRFTGEIRLTAKPDTGALIEVGSLSTRAKIRSKSTIGGYFSIPANIYGNPKLVLGFDGTFEIKQLTIGVSSKIQISSPYPGVEKIIRFQALDGLIADSRLFINATPGDWLYLVNYTGSAWDPALGGIYQIKRISTTTDWVDIEVDATQYPLFSGTHDVVEGALFLFSSTVVPQIVEFSPSTSVTVDQIITQINSQIHSGTAEKLSAEEFIIRTNSYITGSICIFAVIGNASVLISTGQSTNVQSHVAAIQSQKTEGGFPIIQNILGRSVPSDGYGTVGSLIIGNNYTDVLASTTNPSVQSASIVTNYPLGYQEFWQTGRLIGFVGRVYNTSNVAPFSGILRGEDVIRPLVPFDTAIDSGAALNYRNISLRMRDLSVTKDDKFVVEMDLNSIEKTIIVPMHKRAIISSCSTIVGGGNAYTFDFTLNDPDDANKEFFDIYSTFRDFNLNDFRILTKSVGVYKYTGTATAFILRSTDVEAANRLKLSIRYPASPDIADVTVAHKNSFNNVIPETTVLVNLASGPLVSGSLLTVGTLNLSVIPNAGTVDITFTGSSLDPTKYTVGAVLKFAGGHLLSGQYLITSTTGSSVTVNAPGLMRYKTVPLTGGIAYTSSNSSNILVNLSGHGLLNGDKVNITAASAIDGISISDLSVSNADVTAIDLDNFSYTASASANAAPTGSGQIDFPFYTRVLTTTPGSADILVTQTGHTFIGGEGIDITAASSIGGISSGDLSLTGTLITYVNANSYKYTATAIAPAAIGNIDFSRSHTGLTIMTSNSSNVVTVTHVGHKYLTGAILTFSSAVAPTGSALPGSAFAGTKSITVLNVNTYTYVATNVETGTPTANGTVNAQYGPYTATSTTGDNTPTITMVYSGNGLVSGATVNMSASSSIGGIPAINLSITGATITVVNSSTFTYTASLSSPARSGNAQVKRTSRSCTLAVPQLPPPGSDSVTVSVTDHRIQAGEAFYISNVAVGGIGGMSQSDLQNGGSQIFASSIQTSSFVYIASGYGGNQSGTVSFLRLIALQASQYPISSYPLKAAKNTMDNIASKINIYGISSATVIGTGSLVVTQATYSSHPVSYSVLMENFIDMETAYDFHGYSCKYSGSASIYDYNSPTNIRGIVSSFDSIFPTVTESSDGINQLYSPVGEEVYIVPSNGNTLNRWMGFSSISSLSAQANIEETDSSQRIQISSQVVGFNGAVKVKGVTANQISMFVIGNASTDYDEYQSYSGLYGATKVTVDTASAAFVPTGAMVKVENSIVASILRPYRLLSSGASITSANGIDIVTYFRSTNYVQYTKQGSGLGRLLFLRNGMGLSQIEPMTYNGGDIHVTFESVSDNLVKINVNAAELSARIGDMLVIFGDVEKALIYVENVGGTTVRYVLGQGVKSDLWVNANIQISGFSTSGFNGSFTVTGLGVYSGGSYNGYDYIEVANTTGGSETTTATLTIATSNLPFASFPGLTCKTITGGYSNVQEYIGFPVVQVNNSREIIVIAPSIKNEITNHGGPITIILTPNLYPLHRKMMVFLPAIYNEKNIRTNRVEGTQYDTVYNSGNIFVLVKKLFSNFVSIWVSNSASEITDSMELANMQVCTDDWLYCNDEFELANRGTFRIVAHNGRNQVIIYNPLGGTDEYLPTISGGANEWLVGPFTGIDGLHPTGSRPIRVFSAENIFIGDKIKIDSPNSSGGSVAWFPTSLIGSFTIQNTGYSCAANPDNYTNTFDSTLIVPTLDIVMISAPASSDVNNGLPFILGPNATAISFQKASVSSVYRYVAGRTTDPVDRTKGFLYLLPEVNSMPMTSSLGSQISCLFKLGADQNVIRGIDSYLTFAGLVRESHRVIDGNPSNTALYPGVRAAGTSIEILTPLVKSIFVRLQIKPKDGVDSSIIAETVRATVAGYINKLAVGQPVVLAEIIKAVQSLPGVFSVTLIETLPASQGDRIVVGDTEKAIVFDAEKDIVVS